MRKASGKVYVKISALALMSAPLASAYGQVANINCPGNIYFGSLQQTGGGCNGSYSLKVSGGTGTKGACLVIISKAIPGSCSVTLTGANLTKKQSVTVKFTAASFSLTGPGNPLSVTRLRMGATTSGGSKQTLSFTSKNLSTANTIVLNIGGRMNFTPNQTSGKYVGSIKLSTTTN